MSSEHFRILEHTDGEKPEGVDRANCLIRGVLVLGQRSKNPPPNNNVYPAETRRAACGMVEGLQVGVNHPKPDEATLTRPYESTNGLLVNARPTEEGVRADWKLNPKHALTEQILWDAENNPKNLGFSINGDGRRRREDDGSHVVESIERLDSADLVSRPATTSGLFTESRRPAMKKKVSVLIEELRARRPGLSRGLREAVESGIMTRDQDQEDPGGMGCKGPDGADMDPMSADGEEADHEVALKQGFKGAMSAVLDDDSMDMKAKLKKLKEIMVAQEKLMGGGGEGGKGGKGGKGDDYRGKDDRGGKDRGSDYEESKEKTEESLRRMIAVRDLCADEHITPGKVLRKALDGCESLQEARELIAEHKAQQTPTGTGWGAKSGAGSGSPGTAIREGQTGAATVPAGEWNFGTGDDAPEKRLAKLRNTR